jgi:enolase-phosphatase E1
VHLIESSQIRVIVLDIEGTTTPVDFVYKTLFPYASRKLESFLQEHARDPEIQSFIQDLQVQHDTDARNGLHPPDWTVKPGDTGLPAGVTYVRWLIAQDSKCTPLKSLQGKIWQQGFASGELRGEVYPDVPIAFKRWRQQNKIICIYSSGSVLAQQVLFGTTLYGDLRSCISVFFDTQVGPKTEGASYGKIAASFSYAAQQFLFISDVTKEVEAAQSAGMQALLCMRKDDAAPKSGAADVVYDFSGVFPE